jgi:hypothetical protein
VVVPDRCGHRRDALGDADDDGASKVPPAVVFQVELAFESVVDRCDQLPPGFQ